MSQKIATKLTPARLAQYFSAHRKRCIEETFNVIKKKLAINRQTLFIQRGRSRHNVRITQMRRQLCLQFKMIGRIRG